MLGSGHWGRGMGVRFRQGVGGKGRVGVYRQIIQGLLGYQYREIEYERWSIGVLGLGSGCWGRGVGVGEWGSSPGRVVVNGIWGTWVLVVEELRC